MDSFSLSRARGHLFFFVSLGLIIFTGAAGTRAHHSLIRLRNFSVFCFLSGISLVYNSRATISSRCLEGTTTRNIAAAISTAATTSVACIGKRQTLAFAEMEISCTEDYCFIILRNKSYVMLQRQFMLG